MRVKRCAKCPPFELKFAVLKLKLVYAMVFGLCCLKLKKNQTKPVKPILFCNSTQVLFVSYIGINIMFHNPRVLKIPLPTYRPKYYVS